MSECNFGIKEELYDAGGNTSKWGTLTGVKPLKLYNKLLGQGFGDRSFVRNVLKKDYLVSDTKINVLERIHDIQEGRLKRPVPKEVSLYVGIPFCPTRCVYCSFTSNQRDYSEIRKYLNALRREIRFVSAEMKRHKLTAEAIYVGGGTPTTLNTGDLEQLVGMIRELIPVKDNFEFTVEAGRPDTITREKLRALYEGKVGRISINPQTMKDRTLKIIGRDHSTEDVRNAFEMAKHMGFEVINADLIAGLPGENREDFQNTLKEIGELAPENVTVHTLSLKRSSKLMDKFYEKGENPLKGMEKTVRDMVNYGETYLADKGYEPYYIYRQKYMADSLENTGYAKAGTECVYNIRITEEKQTVIAMGAGGTSKVYFPEEDRLERVENVSNYEIYIDRIDEMIERKREKLF